MAKDAKDSNATPEAPKMDATQALLQKIADMERKIASMEANSADMTSVSAKTPIAKREPRVIKLPNGAIRTDL